MFSCFSALFITRGAISEAKICSNKFNQFSIEFPIKDWWALTILFMVKKYITQIVFVDDAKKSKAH